MTPLTIDDNKTIFLSPLLDDEKQLSRDYRRRKNAHEQKSVHPADVPEEETKGWIAQRPGKRSTRLRRLKSHDKWLEDRIWCLLHQMGCRVMNGENFKIAFSRTDGSIGKKQIDVYAEDSETALVVECKSKGERGRRSLQKDIQETISLQSYLRQTIYGRFKDKPLPKVIWIYATSNIIWSEPDIQRAEDRDIKIVTENELQYYETFIKHIGPAGKYQILGEFLPDQKVPGLADIRIPAIRGKLGGHIFYYFVTTPRHLLKISFINHHALNHSGGRPAYQRMISSTRIKKIGAFIEKGGFFPTNILVNFSDTLRFDLISNKDNTDRSIKFVWVTLPSKYRSAWIIDGQHRLYGFSHLDDKCLDQSLFVLAFEKLSVQREADLFITINHEQKSIPRSLLMSLLADVRMGDSDPSTALNALSSAVVRALNSDNNGPLVNRFKIEGVPPSPSQTLTISEAIKGLRRSGLIGKVSGKTLVPGALSGATDEDTIGRALSVLNPYFDAVRTANPGRWESTSSAPIVRNPGIRAHLSVIAEVVKYLSHKSSLDFVLMKPHAFADHVIEFCTPIFDFVRTASDGDITSKFSRKFGEGGVKEYSFHLMQLLTEKHLGFGTTEFDLWMEQSTSEKIDEVNHFLMKLAERLTDHVIDTLKKVHGKHRLPSDEQAFWELGVESEGIKSNAFDAQQKDKKRRKPKEAYLNILDLRAIVKQQNNWNHFEQSFKNPLPKDRRGQKYYLDWMQNFNELRNIAAHKNKLKTYSDEDLEFVEWLRTEVDPNVP